MIDLENIQFSTVAMARLVEMYDVCICIMQTDRQISYVTLAISLPNTLLRAQSRPTCMRFRQLTCLLQ